MTDAEYDVLQSELRATHCSNEGLHDQAASAIRSLRAQISAMSASNDDLTTECARLRAELSDAASALPFVSGSIEHRIRMYRDDMQRRLSSAEAECARLRAEWKAAISKADSDASSLREQISRLQEAGYAYRDQMRAEEQIDHYDYLRTKLHEAEAALAAAQADAERYRWLRRFDHFGTVDAMLDTMEYNTLDAAVDAARAREKTC